MLPIDKILDVMQTEIQFGCHFISKLGTAIFVMFLAMELIKGGIDAAAGRGFSLDKTLYLYLFMAILYAFYPELQWELKKYAFKFCTYIYDNFGKVNVGVKFTWNVFAYLWESIKANPFKAIITMPVTILGAVIVYVVALVVAILSMIAIDIVVLSVFLGFEIMVAAGMFFIPFFMSSDMNHIAKQWVNNMLMYCLQFPLIAMVLKLVEELNKKVAQEVFLEKFLGKGQVLDMFAALFIPLLGLGLVWQALNLSKMLFPPSGGFVGTSIGAPVAAAAAYVMNAAAKIAGGAAGKAAMSEINKWNQKNANQQSSTNQQGGAGRQAGAGQQKSGSQQKSSGAKA